ncbi:hypothetical protein SDC9_210815 [bioreactor metagenome]|uniref:Uncharacterized protein n=1 Tax=bioreactor metagenome TaxID=1076179 RepID=A0A645JHG8_9ZZZZ
MVGTHFQLDTAVKVAVKRTVRTTTARTSAGNRVDLNLAAGGIVFQRAFRGGAKQRKIVVLHEKHVWAGVTFLQHIVGCQR